MILTKIQISNSFRLDDYNSSITYPQMLRPAPQIKDGQTIEFSYVTTEKPQFEYKIL